MSAEENLLLALCPGRHSVLSAVILSTQEAGPWQDWSSSSRYFRKTRHSSIFSSHARYFPGSAWDEYAVLALDADIHSIVSPVYRAFWDAQRQCDIAKKLRCRVATTDALSTLGAGLYRKRQASFRSTCLQVNLAARAGKVPDSAVENILVIAQWSLRSRPGGWAKKASRNPQPEVRHEHWRLEPLPTAQPGKYVLECTEWRMDSRNVEACSFRFYSPLTHLRPSDGGRVDGLQRRQCRTLGASAAACACIR